MNASFIVSGLGLFACGVALTLLFGYRWVHQALQDSFTDGAAFMFEEVRHMQTHTYIALAGDQNKDFAGREITLQTLDAVVIGLQATMNELRGESRKENAQ